MPRKKKPTPKTLVSKIIGDLPMLAWPKPMEDVEVIIAAYEGLDTWFTQSEKQTDLWVSDNFTLYFCSIIPLNSDTYGFIRGCERQQCRDSLQVRRADGCN